MKRHGREGAVDFVLRPNGDGPGSGTPRGDVGALTGLAQYLLSRGVRHAHRTLDKKHAKRLIVDRPGPEFGSADTNDRDGGPYTYVRPRQLRRLAGEKPEGADHPDLDSAPARGRIEHERIERQLRPLAERHSRPVGEGDFQSRRFSGRHDLVEENGRLEAKRLGDAAMCSARFPL